jgi:hypothetical protein
VIVEAARDHLVGGLHDGSRPVVGQEPEVPVHQGAGLLEDAERPDHLAGKPLAADPEVLHGALRLGAPVAVGGDLDGAHGVALGPGGRARDDRAWSAPSALPRSLQPCGRQMARLPPPSRR